MQCEVCSADVAQPVSKFGKPYGRPKRFCSDRCRGIAKRAANLTTGWCHFCGSSFSRPARGDDCAKYCSRSCYENKKTSLKLELLSMRRISDAWKVVQPDVKGPGVVAIEVAGIRRLGRLTKKCKTVRPCRGGCGKRLPGIAEYSRTCVDCTARLRRESESYKAQKRKYKSARRALERGLDAERIDPIEVLDADGWRCYICGVDTPRELRGTYEPNAPEVDHVIPLAAGGKHVRGNLRCACRSCNGTKGAKYQAGDPVF